MSGQLEKCFVDLKSNLVLKSNKGHNLLKSAPFLDLMPLLPPSFVGRASRQGIKSKAGAKKCCKENKCIAAPNEWHNIPFFRGNSLNDLRFIEKTKEHIKDNRLKVNYKSALL